MKSPACNQEVLLSIWAWKNEKLAQKGGYRLKKNVRNQKKCLSSFFTLLSVFQELQES